MPLSLLTFVNLLYINFLTSACISFCVFFCEFGYCSLFKKQVISSLNLLVFHIIFAHFGMRIVRFSRNNSFLVYYIMGCIIDIVKSKVMHRPTIKQTLLPATMLQTFLMEPVCLYATIVLSTLLSSPPLPICRIAKWKPRHEATQAKNLTLTYILNTHDILCRADKVLL